MANPQKLDAKFLVVKAEDIREQFGVNQWLERNRVTTSLELAKRAEILLGLRQVHWDLVIVDESHRMSAADESHKSLCYRPGELLRDSSNHFLLLTATRATTPRARPARRLRTRRPASRDAAAAPFPEPSAWLHEHMLAPLLNETRRERLSEMERVTVHVELFLTELLNAPTSRSGAHRGHRARRARAEGPLVQAKNRHGAARAERAAQNRSGAPRTLSPGRRTTRKRPGSPASEREAAEVPRLRPNLKTEAVAMRVVMEHERDQGRQVYEVHEQDLGYDVTSLDLASGELRLIEVKGLGAASGTILLTPNERRVAEDRLIVTGSTLSRVATEPPIRNRSVTLPASTGTR